MSGDAGSPPAVGHDERAVIGNNGLAANGLTINGIGGNGLTINGLTINGLTINGLTINGLTINGLTINGLTINGLDLDEGEEVEAEKILAYMIECALPATESVLIQAGDGTPRIYSGLFGLAPEWQTGPLSLAGERSVSACLAARANNVGRTVSISLRHPAIPVTDVEVDLYTTHEGAFWGNFFGEDPAMYACRVKGGGLSGRVCAESASCGFTFVGDCADACDARDPVTGYGLCGDGRHGEVMNTYLNLGSRISFGDNNICLIGTDGMLSCRGANDHGQLGNGNDTEQAAPVVVSALGSGVAEVAIQEHACARMHDGSLYCWGNNHDGQVGDGTQTDQLTPVHVADDIASFTQSESHTCAVSTDATVWCWGNNKYGQLGIHKNGAKHLRPEVVPGLSLAMGRLASTTTARHTCALTVDGEVFCWGRNNRGQLGNGIIKDSDAPVAVDQDEDGIWFGGVTDLCASRERTCARKADGSMWCWGKGKGKRPGYQDSDVAPDSLACGERHVCYVKEDSTVWCFGENKYGQLGFDTGSNEFEAEGDESEGDEKLTPGQVIGLRGASAVSVARTVSCATLTDGSVWCWGKDPGAYKGMPLFDVPLSITPTQITP